MALQTFNQLQNRWPSSAEAGEAKDFRVRAEEKLAKKQLYLAGFYLKQKKYFPALKRLEALNNEQTPMELRREALYKLGVVHLKMKNPDIARQAFERLVSENIDDEYQRKSKNKLSEISK